MEKELSKINQRSNFLNKEHFESEKKELAKKIEERIKELKESLQTLKKEQWIK